MHEFLGGINSLSSRNTEKKCETSNTGNAKHNAKESEMIAAIK